MKLSLKKTSILDPTKGCKNIVLVFANGKPENFTKKFGIKVVALKENF